MHRVIDLQLATEQKLLHHTSGQSFSSHTESVEGRAERSPSSCFHSLSQSIIAIQLTTRHIWAVLIASHPNEWVEAYGEKRGERWADGVPSGLVWESLSKACMSFHLWQSPPSTWVVTATMFGTMYVTLIMGLEKKHLFKHLRPSLCPKICCRLQMISPYTSVPAQLWGVENNGDKLWIQPRCSEIMRSLVSF